MKSFIQRWWDSNIIGIEGYFNCKKCKKIHAAFSKRQWWGKLCPKDYDIKYGKTQT